MTEKMLNTIFNFFFSPDSTLLAMQVFLLFGVLGVSALHSLTTLNQFREGIGSLTNSSWLNNFGLNYRKAAVILTFIPLFWSLYLWYLYDASLYTYQMVCYLSLLHINVGVDTLGLSLVILTCALFPICVILMRTYTGVLTFLLLEVVILGSLTVLDLLGFYILFEASLILLFLLIARTPYGSIDAAYKIVLYTMAGSLVLLPVIFMLYSENGSTNLFLLTTASDSSFFTTSRQNILGWGMLAVFSVKIPLMPVHLWLPEAHVAAPTSGSVLLAGVLLKLGGLGFLRFMIPLLPSFTVWCFPLICTMCLCSFLFSTLSTIRQVDLKKIVAYSSISHMSLVTLSIFSMSEHSTFASTYMMIAHGIVSPGLFLLVGFLYERTHTKFLAYYSGLGSYMPLYSLCFFILTCCNLSFPLSPNFVAEVLCLVSLFSVHELYSFIFCIAQILGAVYAFWAFNRVIHGVRKVSYSNNAVGLLDLTRVETLIITPVMIAVIWLGIFPMA